MQYAPRTVDAELDSLLLVAPAIALDGPKAVGKTRTALSRATSFRLLDDPDQRALTQADPTFADVPPGTLLLDEWQRLPQTWDAVRRRVDDGAPAGRFLLTGSATPRAGVDTHSGSGRILSLRMRPMALFERPGHQPPTVSLTAMLEGEATVTGTTSIRASHYFEAITASGFPGITSSPTTLRRRQLDAYLQRVVDRELPDHGLAIRRPETLRRWLAAYAAASSTVTSYSKLLDATTGGDGTQPAKTTTISYRDHLTALWLLDPVPAWTPSRSPLSRLQQAPKHQLADPALAARLLSLSAEALGSATGAAMAGPLFESLATLSVRVAAQAADGRVGHLRTGNGDHEIDLVVEGADGQVVAVEVKLAASVDDADVRHLLWLRDQRRHMGDDVVDVVVLTTGSTAYRRSDGVAVVPLSLLGP